MNRRLQQFLELEQLKPAQFADIMGIQRSNVSHILSGRNKPGFDFIQKFLLKFPSVNPDWLLLGRGKPLREQNTSAPAPRQQDSSPDLFSPIHPNSFWRIFACESTLKHYVQTAHPTYTLLFLA